MARVRVTTGSEGPRHDPYGWTKIIFTRTDGVVVEFKKSGLGYDWVQCEQLGELARSFGDDPKARTIFESLTGMSPDEAEEIPERLSRRYLKRLSPSQRWQHEEMMDYDRRLLSYAM